MTIDGILDAADHATPGPWFAINNGCYFDINIKNERYVRSVAAAWVYDDFTEAEKANASLVAGAPQLAAEVRRLRAENANLVEALEYWDAVIPLTEKNESAKDKNRAAIDAYREARDDD